MKDNQHEAFFTLILDVGIYEVASWSRPAGSGFTHVQAPADPRHEMNGPPPSSGYDAIYTCGYAADRWSQEPFSLYVSRYRRYRICTPPLDRLVQVK